METRKTFVFLMLLQFIVISAHAQVTTGTLQGRLLSTEGTPIVDANLITAGPSLLGESGTTTALDGTFQFFSLPLGTYKLTITHVSYGTHEIVDIPINLGEATNLGPIQLSTEQTQLDEVVLLGSRPVLPVSVTSVHSLSKNTMDKIPVGRDFKEAVAILPLVNASYFGDQLSIAGGTGSENLFYVDGISVTAIYTPPGTPGTFTTANFLPYNFIKEVKVTSSGFEAQYGNALGGTVDVVTQSGSNDFSGQVFGFLSGSFLNSKPEGGTTGSVIDKTSNFDGGFSIGGPIIKDKLWYYTAYSYYKNEQGVEVKGHGFYPDKSISQVLAAKFDWLVSPATKLNLTLMGNPSTATPVLGYSWWYSYPNLIQDPEAVLSKYKSGGINAILRGNSKLNGKTELEYALNYYRYRSKYGATTIFGDTQPQLDDLITGILSGGLGWIEDNVLNKIEAKISVSHKLVSHNLKVGFETGYNNLKGRNYTPGLGAIQRDGFGYTVGYLNFDNNFNNTLYTAYFQDSWKMTDRVVLQYGLRWDGLTFRDDNTVLQRFNNQYQPRLSATWFLNEEETKKLSFYYGKVYQARNPLTGRFFNINGLEYYAFYDTDPRIEGTEPYDVFVRFDPSETPVRKPGKYKMDNMDHFGLSYSQLIRPGLRFRVSGLYKELRDLFQFATDMTTGISVVGNPGRGDLDFLPKAIRQYYTAELAIQGDHIENFSYSIAYVLSRAYGNSAGNYSAEDQIPIFGGGGVNTQAAIPFSIGLLPNDRTHVLKLNAAYTFPFGLTAGTFLLIQSGTPLSEYAPGGFGSIAYLSERGSAGRTPTLWDLNFRFSYKHSKFPGIFYLDMFHVGDPQTVVVQDQYRYNDRFQAISNPNYGKPVKFQPPMAVRLGVEFNF